MFIKTIEGDWINTDHITRFDVSRLNSTVVVKAWTSSYTYDYDIIHTDDYTGDESIDQMQDWLDHFIYDMSLD